jgi:hypothetical protein
MKHIVTLAALALAVSGCADSGSNVPPTASPKPGVKVDAPGVNVDVERGGKTDVNAPGVNVRVKPTKNDKNDD